MTEQLGLLLDYGGVLTPPVGQVFAVFEAEHGIPPGRTFELLVAASRDETGGLIGAIERGELSVEDFDGHLRRLLHDAGHDRVQEAVVSRMFAGLVADGPLWDVARRARAAGVRVGLLSNSWGTDMYPRDLLDDHFDVQVISGEVGLRKPEPAIYELALQRMGLPAASVAFVDDLGGNLAPAERLGMRAVLHTDHDTTIGVLEDHLGMSLREGTQSGG
ncbi:MAG: HAD-IA family hydrolase [Actinobacteria bacterium]|jgi:putative hydrolase of the HAD superfamily|nr:HAD-IA family hydrolase [Actinomycetota bacterium]